MNLPEDDFSLFIKDITIAILTYLHTTRKTSKQFCLGLQDLSFAIYYQHCRWPMYKYILIPCICLKIFVHAISGLCLCVGLEHNTYLDKIKIVKTKAQ